MYEYFLIRQFSETQIYIEIMFLNIAIWSKICRFFKREIDFLKGKFDRPTTRIETSTIFRWINRPSIISTIFMFCQRKFAEKCYVNVQ